MVYKESRIVRWLLQNTSLPQQQNSQGQSQTPQGYAIPETNSPVFILLLLLVVIIIILIILGIVCFICRHHFMFLYKQDVIKIDKNVQFNSINLSENQQVYESDLIQQQQEIIQESQPVVSSTVSNKQNQGQGGEIKKIRIVEPSNQFYNIMNEHNSLISIQNQINGNRSQADNIILQNEVVPGELYIQMRISDHSELQNFGQRQSILVRENINNGQVMPKCGEKSMTSEQENKSQTMKLLNESQNNQSNRSDSQYCKLNIVNIEDIEIDALSNKQIYSNNIRNSKILTLSINKQFQQKIFDVQKLQKSSSSNSSGSKNFSNQIIFKQNRLDYENEIDLLFPQFKNGFDDTKTFIDENCRKNLPYLLPPNYTVPIWKILGKFVQSDLSKISLPVALCEPLGTLQKSCELLINMDMLENAANRIPLSDIDDPESSCLRLLTCSLISILSFSLQTQRLKKVFNPILGETFEFVNDRFKFISEQVSHHPPISAYCFYGNGYYHEGYNWMKQQFKIGGGSGQFFFQQTGLHYFKLDRFNDDINITKPNLIVDNLILGVMYLDLQGTVKGINKTTGDTCQITCNPKSWTSKSNLVGQCHDSYGNKLFEIHGSWQNEVYIKNIKRGTTELLWKRPNYFPDNYERQYNFNQLSVQLNYLPKEIQEAKNNTNKCFIAPTDSRFRGDLRLFEEGQFNEADQEKTRLEIKQRMARQQDNGQFSPNFFVQIEEDNQFSKQKEIRYIEKQGCENYWERRKMQEWENLPDLF